MTEEGVGCVSLWGESSGITRKLPPTVRPSVRPTFIVLFRILSAHNNHLSVSWVAGVGNMVKHETTLFKWWWRRGREREKEGEDENGEKLVYGQQKVGLLCTARRTATENVLWGGWSKYRNAPGY